MGYYTRSSGQIKCFEPDNSETELYIQGEYGFSEIFEKIKEHFGEDSKFEDFTIEPEYIHTDCLGWDEYDPGDYTEYLCIRRRA